MGAAPNLIFKKSPVRNDAHFRLPAIPGLFSTSCSSLPPPQVQGHLDLLANFVTGNERELCQLWGVRAIWGPGLEGGYLAVWGSFVLEVTGSQP
eukprot:738748-Pelagomonas_calceolata.AAC.2